MTPRGITFSFAVLALVGAAGVAGAHVTPPVVLVSDREAVVRLLPGATKFSVREVRLSPAERQNIKTRWGWNADEDFYRFYLGRDDGRRLLSATIFLTEYTVHGPVRVAVGLGPDGKVSGATVVELTEETYAWVKPLLDQDFAREYVGRDSHASFAPTARLAGSEPGSMTRFYAQVALSLLQRASILWEVGVLGRGGST